MEGNIFSEGSCSIDDKISLKTLLVYHFDDNEKTHCPSEFPKSQKTYDKENNVINGKYSLENGEFPFA